MSEDDATMGTLKPGSFYWVKPVFDVDFTPPGFKYQEYSPALHEAMQNHWTQNEQPARFEGYDENGNEKWLYIGVDKNAAPWPTCWVGKEIIGDA